ncbi:transglutaminase-like cysteine peptidase [Tsuneonella sp. HG222]
MAAACAATSAPAQSIPASLSLTERAGEVRGLYGSCAGTAALLTSAPSPGQIGKSAAILGGAVSALDAIRLQQMSGGSLYRPASAPVSAVDSVDSIVRCGAIASKSLLQSSTLISPILPIPAIRPAASTVPAPEAAQDTLFGPKVRIGQTTLDRKWNAATARTFSRSKMRRMVRTTSGMSRDDLLQEVNRWANRTVAYVGDARTDEWTDALATVRRGRGDCEDIAILKYQALMALGADADEVFFTVAYDRVRRIDHAFVVVKTDAGYRVLDSGTDELLDETAGRDYVPIYSFNSRGKWLHGQSVPTPAIPPTQLAYLSVSEDSSARLIGLKR